MKRDVIQTNGVVTGDVTAVTANHLSFCACASVRVRLLLPTCLSLSLLSPLVHVSLPFWCRCVVAAARNVSNFSREGGADTAERAEWAQTELGPLN